MESYPQHTYTYEEIKYEWECVRHVCLIAGLLLFTLSPELVWYQRDERRENIE